MNGLHPLRERQARRQEAIDQQVRQATAAAVVDVLAKHEAGESQPYRIDLLREPRGITAREYVQRVQDGTLTMLGATGLDGSLECDDFISAHANAKALHRRRQNLFTRHYHPGLRLLFREPRPVK